MSTLSRRLQRIQERVEAPLPALESLSLEQMEKQVMDFGKAHVGKCYRQMWEQEQAYISWFVSHYQASTKLEHRKFLQYITCKVDRAELTGERIPVKPAEKDLDVFTGKGYGKQSPKAKSRGRPMASTSAIPEAAMDEMNQLVQKGFVSPEEAWQSLEADHFEIVQNEEILEEPTHPEIGHLESRMLNLENALSRVIQHLEVLSTQPQTPPVDQ